MFKKGDKVYFRKSDQMCKKKHKMSENVTTK